MPQVSEPKRRLSVVSVANMKRYSAFWHLLVVLCGPAPLAESPPFAGGQQVESACAHSVTLHKHIG